jgi:phage-related protein
MTWEVETEPEVTDWYLGLSGEDRDVVAERIDLLANFGHMLRMPHVRPLGRGLVELRFDMSRRSWRITYWHRPDGVIILLTVFRKQRDNEAREVDRARRALEACQTGHI